MTKKNKLTTLAAIISGLSIFPIFAGAEFFLSPVRFNFDW